MIKSLKIQNFQSHAKTELEFSPGVNVIVGTSDSGKTAIIRALRWVRWNRPSGDAFRSKWGGSTSVLVECEEAKVSRIKDKSDKFLLRPKGRDEMEFKAFGTNVPEEIVALLNLDEINLQSQHDAPFLISDSPGVVAAHFNRVAGLDKIDEATSRINGWMRELAADIKYKEAEEERLREQYTQFEYLDKFEAEVEVVEGMERLLTQQKNASRELSRILLFLQRISLEMPRLQALMDIESKVNELNEKRRQEQSLILLLNNIDTIEEQIAADKDALTLESIVEETLEKYEKYGNTYNLFVRLKTILDNNNTLDRRLKTIKTKVDTLQAKFDKEMGDVCILCGQTIKK